MSFSESTTLASKDFPPASLRERIACATRAAVRLATGGSCDGTAQLCVCVLYAYAGAIVASALTENGYEASAGSLQVRIGEPGEPLFLEAQTQVTGPVQYHAWFVARHPGGRMEVADFCVQHYPAQTDHRTPTWSGGVRSWYVWDWADTLLADIRFAPDTAAKDHVRAWYSRHLDLVHGIAEHAFKLAQARRCAA